MRRATYNDKTQEVLNNLLGKQSEKEKPPKNSTWFSKPIPEIKPLTLRTGALIFGGIATLGILIGATIGTYVYFGAVTLAGLIAISESNKYVRHAIKRSNKFIDLSIFALTVYATVTLGTTLTAALTFAGLGYTLVYAPYLRSRT